MDIGWLFRYCGGSVFVFYVGGVFIKLWGVFILEFGGIIKILFGKIEDFLEFFIFFVVCGFEFLVKVFFVLVFWLIGIKFGFFLVL